MGYRLSKIYTRTGDDGTTSLDGQERLLKNALRIEAVGTLDELNCAIGLALSHPPIHPEVYECLCQVQNELFDLGGELHVPERIIITAEKITHLEEKLDHWNETLPPLKEFLLPRGNSKSAACHVARTVCRRAERSLVRLHRQTPLANPEILRYLNRLSDLLFIIARILARESEEKEVLWDNK